MAADDGAAHGEVCDCTEEIDGLIARAEPVDRGRVEELAQRIVAAARQECGGARIGEGGGAR